MREQLEDKEESNEAKKEEREWEELDRGCMIGGILTGE